MPTKYTVRVASNVQYEYWEASSDTFEEMLAAEQELRELKNEAGAVEKVTSAFGARKVEEPATGGFGKKAAGTFGRGQQAQQEAPERVALGEHEGYKIELNVSGQFAKYGPNVGGWNPTTKARLKTAKLPAGMSWDQVDLDAAVAMLAEVN